MLKAWSPCLSVHPSVIAFLYGLEIEFKKNGMSKILCYYLQELFLTQIWRPLCPDLTNFIFRICCTHVQGKGALLSYLKSLVAQNLSSFFTNDNRFLAFTTLSGSLFHILNILFVKENFLMSFRDLGFDIFRLFPPVAAVFKSISGVTFSLKLFRILHVSITSSRVRLYIKVGSLSFRRRSPYGRFFKFAISLAARRCIFSRTLIMSLAL